MTNPTEPHIERLDSYMTSHDNYSLRLTRILELSKGDEQPQFLLLLFGTHHQRLLHLLTSTEFPREREQYLKAYTRYQTLFEQCVRSHLPLFLREAHCTFPAEEIAQGLNPVISMAILMQNYLAMLHPMPCIRARELRLHRPPLSGIGDMQEKLTRLQMQKLSYIGFLYVLGDRECVYPVSKPRAFWLGFEVCLLNTHLLPNENCVETLREWRKRSHGPDEVAKRIFNQLSLAPFLYYPDISGGYRDPTMTFDRSTIKLTAEKTFGRYVAERTVNEALTKIFKARNNDPHPLVKKFQQHAELPILPEAQELLIASIMRVVTGEKLAQGQSYTERLELLKALKEDLEAYFEGAHSSLAPRRHFAIALLLCSHLAGLLEFNCYQKLTLFEDILSMPPERLAEFYTALLVPNSRAPIADPFAFDSFFEAHLDLPTQWRPFLWMRYAFYCYQDPAQAHLFNELRVLEAIEGLSGGHLPGAVVAELLYSQLLTPHLRDIVEQIRQGVRSLKNQHKESFLLPIHIVDALKRNLDLISEKRLSLMLSCCSLSNNSITAYQPFLSLLSAHEDPQRRWAELHSGMLIPLAPEFRAILTEGSWCEQGFLLSLQVVDLNTFASCHVQSLLAIPATLQGDPTLVAQLQTLCQTLCDEYTHSEAPKEDGPHGRACLDFLKGLKLGVRHALWRLSESQMSFSHGKSQDIIKSGNIWSAKNGLLLHPTNDKLEITEPHYGILFAEMVPLVDALFRDLKTREVMTRPRFCSLQIQSKPSWLSLRIPTENVEVDLILTPGTSHDTQYLDIGIALSSRPTVAVSYRLVDTPTKEEMVKPFAWLLARLKSFYYKIN